MDLAALAEHGFDIAHTFDANAIAREPGLGMLAGKRRLGVLIGNTRALWPRLLAARATLDAQHPVQDLTERTIVAAFPGSRVMYSHRRYDGAFVPFQRIAVATGLGALSDGGLVIHPVHGPWFALRAVVLVEGEPVARAPIAKPCVCDAACGVALKAALAGRDWRKWLDVRDSCKLRESRYSEEQIRYHYLKVF